jgi:hypothetical protein
VTKLSWLLAPTLLFAFTACSDGDDDDTGDKQDDDTDETEDDSSGGEDREAYIAALIDSMGEDDDFGSDEANDCVAGAVVDVVGLENLQGKVTPDELANSEDLEELGLELEPGAWWDAANECTDMDLWLMTQMADGDTAIAECLVENTTPEHRRALFVAGSNGSDLTEATAALDAAEATCGTTDTTAAG